jgi:hypothetical protein
MKFKNTKVLNDIQDFVCFPILRPMNATPTVGSNNLPKKCALYSDVFDDGCGIYFPKQQLCRSVSKQILYTANQFIHFRNIHFLQIRIQFTYILKTSYAYIKIAGLVIIDFYVKIIHLIEAYTKATVVPFCQEHALRGKHFCLCHPVHKIEIPYIHKEVLSVLAPDYPYLIQITYRYYRPGHRIIKY